MLFWHDVEGGIAAMGLAWPWQANFAMGAFHPFVVTESCQNGVAILSDGILPSAHIDLVTQHCLVSLGLDVTITLYMMILKV